MANQTLLDDILSFSTETPNLADEQPSTSQPEDSFPTPVNFLEEYLNLNVTEGIVPTNGTRTLDQLFNFIEYHPYLLYSICTLCALIVISVIVSIVVWIYKHKKRVINQHEDPMLSSTYSQGIRWRKLCCCCCCCGCKKKKDDTTTGIEVRQNSASNLEAYGRREPLPETAYRQTSVISDVPKIHGDLIDDKQLAIHIDGIHNVPSTHIPPHQYRELPPLRLPRTNIYQNYS